MADGAKPGRGADLGLALALLRTTRRWSQHELAKAAGVRINSVSEYELDKKRPELESLMRLLEAMGYQLSAIERTYRYLDDLRAGRSTGLPASLEALLAGAGPAAPLPGQVEVFSAELGRTVERLSRSLLGMVLADRPGGGVPGEEEAPGGDPPPRSFAFAQDDGGGRSRSRGGRR